MNPTSEASPIPVSLVCRAARWWCTVTDASTSAHVAQCDACQRHFASMAALSAALRAEASGALTALDPATTQRTARAVRDAQATQTLTANETPRDHRGIPVLAGIAAAAGLAAIAILIQPTTQPVKSPTPASVAAMPRPPVSPEAVLLVEALQSWSQQWSESVLPSAGELAANNPLQAEMVSVYADARAALDFLALNFLPLMPAPGEPEPTPKSTG